LVNKKERGYIIQQPTTTYQYSVLSLTTWAGFLGRIMEGKIYLWDWVGIKYGIELAMSINVNFLEQDSTFHPLPTAAILFACGKCAHQ
jgi:hypothetical protein